MLVDGEAVKVLPADNAELLKTTTSVQAAKLVFELRLPNFD
jgi:hypothetical protein